MPETSKVADAWSSSTRLELPMAPDPLRASVPSLIDVSPVKAVLLAESVSVLAFVGLIVLVGLKDAITPAGKPEVDKITLPLNPFCALTEIALVPLVPCVTVTLAGEADNVKSGVGGVRMLTDTLSKVAVARAAVLPLSTARPTYTVEFMVMA